MAGREKRPGDGAPGQRTCLTAGALLSPSQVAGPCGTAAKRAQNSGNTSSGVVCMLRAPVALTAHDWAGRRATCRKPGVTRGRQRLDSAGWCAGWGVGVGGTREGAIRQAAMQHMCCAQGMQRGGMQVGRQGWRAEQQYAVSAFLPRFRHARRCAIVFLATGQLVQPARQGSRFREQALGQPGAAQQQAHGQDGQPVARTETSRFGQVPNSLRGNGGTPAC